MPAAIDITGQVFGRLTAIGKVSTGKGRGMTWELACECGGKTYASSNSVRSGHTTSCGCLRREAASKANSLDIAGRRFGLLTAITRVGTNASKSAVWEFRCDCGNTLNAPVGRVNSGHTKSCGCLKGGVTNPKFKDLTGQTFNKLTVLSLDRFYGGSSFWLCQCKCGNTVSVQAGSLKSGNTKSCGCFIADIGKANRTDYTGKRFGILTVVGEASDRRDGKLRLKLKCDCGGEKIALANDLASGRVVSCGCAKHAHENRPLMPAEARRYTAVASSRRRARKLSVGGKFSVSEIEALHERQRGLCAYCRAPLKNNFHRDHITPLSRGGSNDITNIQLLCPSCNQRKCAKDPIEFAQQMGLLL